MLKDRIYSEGSAGTFVFWTLGINNVIEIGMKTNQYKAFENVVCQMGAILFLPQCVNHDASTH